MKKVLVLITALISLNVYANDSKLWELDEDEVSCPTCAFIKEGKHGKEFFQDRVNQGIKENKPSEVINAIFQMRDESKPEGEEKSVAMSTASFIGYYRKLTGKEVDLNEYKDYLSTDGKGIYSMVKVSAMLETLTKSYFSASEAYFRSKSHKELLDRAHQSEIRGEMFISNRHLIKKYIRADK